tara:strand:+ start:5946 stop:6842 length:897 start_codon:yes stop_codon:yes gene_type:complete
MSEMKLIMEDWRLFVESPSREELLLESVESQISAEFSKAADKIDDELEDQILAALKKAGDTGEEGETLEENELLTEEIFSTAWLIVTLWSSLVTLLAGGNLMATVSRWGVEKVRMWQAGSGRDAQGEVPEAQRSKLLRDFENFFETTARTAATIFMDKLGKGIIGRIAKPGVWPNKQGWLPHKVESYNKVIDKLADLAVFVVCLGAMGNQIMTAVGGVDIAGVAGGSEATGSVTNAFMDMAKSAGVSDFEGIQGVIELAQTSGDLAESPNQKKFLKQAFSMIKGALTQSNEFTRGAMA